MYLLLIYRLLLRAARLNLALRVALSAWPSTIDCSGIDSVEENSLTSIRLENAHGLPLLRWH